MKRMLLLSVAALAIPSVAAAEAVETDDGRTIIVTGKAEGYKAETVAAAESEAAVFKAVYEKYRQAPDITRTRLLIETLEDVLSSSAKLYLVDSDSGVTKLLDLTGGDISATDAAAVTGGE